MKRIFVGAAVAAVLLSGVRPAIADAVVAGDYVKFGVGDNGALVNSALDGVQFSRKGGGDFTPAYAYDFFTTGTPVAFYSIGVGGTFAAANAKDVNNPFGSSTSAYDAGDTSFVITSGGSYNGLRISQVISLEHDSNRLHTSVVLTNVSGGTLHNVAYAVGINPSVDMAAAQYDSSINTITGQGVNAGLEVESYFTGYTIQLRNTSGWDNTVASIRSGQSADPYLLSGPTTDAGGGDKTVSLGYSFGSLDAGQQIAIGYDYIMTAPPIPEPSTYAMLLAGLGLVGFVARRKRVAS